MPNTASADRLAESGTVASISWEPWLDMPSHIMDRFGLREWNMQMRLRDQANKDKIQQEITKLQNQVKGIQ